MIDTPVTRPGRRISQIYREERRLEMLRWLTRNRQAPYLILIAGGTAITLLGRLLYDEDATEEDEKNFWEALAGGVKTAGTGALAMSGVGGLLALVASGETGATDISGATLASVGITCLILDAKAGGQPTIGGSPLNSLNPARLVESGF